MNRRRFGTLLGGTAAAWPLAARAQQVPIIGLLLAGSPDTFASSLMAFRKGLKELGYVEGQNVLIEYRWAAGGQYDQLPALAADLVNRRVAVIATPNSTPATRAAKAATATIPIVFAVGSDPIEQGLVASLNRPGGNLTGVSMLTVTLAAKRLGLLSELVPSAGVMAMLINPNTPPYAAETREVQSAARALGKTIHFLHAASERDFDAVFQSLGHLQAGALLVSPDVFFVTQRDRITALAARAAIPAMYHRRDFVEAGGLTSYGDDYTDAWRQVGVYVGRILKGEQPATLPVFQPTKFEFIINLKTARTLGLDVPPKLLAVADEVME
jgi:putative tryptophan/tyrosine transport system substrate-binding protein